VGLEAGQVRFSVPLDAGDLGDRLGALFQVEMHQASVHGMRVFIASAAARERAPA
jgi:hypothetical protein